MRTGFAIKAFSKMLKKDKGMREAIHANIAMAFDDCYHQYRSLNKVTKPSARDIRIISNSASEYFLRLISDDKKKSNTNADGMVALGLDLIEIIKEQEKISYK